MVDGKSFVRDIFLVFGSPNDFACRFDWESGGSFFFEHPLDIFVVDSTCEMTHVENVGIRSLVC